jgi:hypothetical protein
MNDFDERLFFESLEGELAEVWLVTIQEVLQEKQRAERKSLVLVTRDCSQCHQQVRTAHLMIEPDVPADPGIKTFCFSCKEVTDSTVVSVQKAEVGGER